MSSVPDRRARLSVKPGAFRTFFGSSTERNAFSRLLSGKNSSFPLGQQLLSLLNTNNLQSFVDGAITNLAGTIDNMPGIVTNLASSIFSGNTGFPGFTPPKQIVTAALGRSLLGPLANTRGLVWPYTPNIAFSQAAEYDAYAPVHVNNEFFAYTRTMSPDIVVSGSFAPQNQDEAVYALAAIHFMRTVIKMNFGQDEGAGTPPPILLFNAYGEFMFNDIPVILMNFNIEHPDNVDYIQIVGSNTFIPSQFVITATLKVQITPSQARSFSLSAFRNGDTMRGRGGFI